MSVDRNRCYPVSTTRLGAIVNRLETRSAPCRWRWTMYTCRSVDQTFVHHLRRIWRQNRDALRQLADLPSGPVDPTVREQNILIAQELIEHELGYEEVWRLREEEEHEGWLEE